MMTIQNVTVLGATGSIGVSTLDVLARHPERYAVFALTADRKWQVLATQCLEHHPRYAVLNDEAAALALAQELRSQGCKTEVLLGADALAQVASHADVHVVMAAIVGAAGLLPTLAAVNAGKKVLLANKEALVMAGGLFTRAVAEHGATLLPIDSEHNAIFQCLPNHRADYLVDGLQSSGVRKILLTASGGPFRNTPLADLKSVTPEQACAHPNWSMGQKISVDSATMLNKGLELIEACWLFNTRPEQVQVVIHPQSIIHSMVVCRDQSVLAQLGTPDMRVPIAYGLSFPERIESGAQALDFLSLKALTFEAPERARFPGLFLAWDALNGPAGSTAVLNAANEVAVEAFLAGQIRFDAIPGVNAQALSELVPAAGADASIESLLALDEQARRVAQAIVQRVARAL